MRRVVLSAGFLLCITGLLCCSGIDTSSKRQVRIALGGVAAVDHLPVYVAQGLGFFQEEGLAVAVESLAGDSKALQALTGGSADVMCGGFDAALQLAAAGRDVKAFVTIMQFPGISLVAPPAKNFHRIEQLRNSVVGVTAPGSATHLFVTHIALRHQINPAAIKVVGVGAGSPMVAALQLGQIDAAAVGVLTLTRLLSEPNGVRVLVNGMKPDAARELYDSDAYPGSALIAADRWLRQDTERARRISRAIQRALGWIHQHTPEEIVKAVPARFINAEPALYQKAIQNIVPILSKDGHMPPQAPHTVFEWLARSSERVRGSKLDPASTFTNDHLDPSFFEKTR